MQAQLVVVVVVGRCFCWLLLMWTLLVCFFRLMLLVLRWLVLVSVMLMLLVWVLWLLLMVVVGVGVFFSFVDV